MKIQDRYRVNLRYIQQKIHDLQLPLLTCGKRSLNVIVTTDVLTTLGELKAVFLCAYGHPIRWPQPRHLKKTKPSKTIINKSINEAVFQLYHGDQFQWWRKPEYPERTTDPGQATGKLYHLPLRVECTLFCKLQSWARIHAALVIGLYELLDPTTELIEPPGPLYL